MSYSKTSYTLHRAICVNNKNNPLKIDMGLIIHPDYSSNQAHVLILSFRRQIKKSKSVIQLLLFGDETNEDDTKSKNIRQTGRCTHISNIKYVKICFCNYL
jgi:hypothetical protein